MALISCSIGAGSVWIDGEIEHGTVLYYLRRRRASGAVMWMRQELTITEGAGLKRAKN